MEILLILLLITIAVFVVFIISIRNMIIKRKKEIIAKFKDKEILLISSNANYFGTETLKSFQIRGNGFLILTKDELFFQMWTSKKEISIPISNLRSTETVKSFLGKTVFAPLLKVNFQNEHNDSDSIAWLVKNLHQWVKTINDLIKK